jgi:hypothetical protein
MLADIETTANHDGLVPLRETNRDWVGFEGSLLDLHERPIHLILLDQS